MPLLATGLGVVAIVLSLSMAVPQAIVIWRDGSTVGVSVSTFLLFSLTFSAWVGYSLRSGNYVVLVVNVLSIATTALLLLGTLRAEGRRRPRSIVAPLVLQRMGSPRGPRQPVAPGHGGAGAACGLVGARAADRRFGPFGRCWLAYGRLPGHVVGELRRGVVLARPRAPRGRRTRGHLRRRHRPHLWSSAGPRGSRRQADVGHGRQRVGGGSTRHLCEGAERGTWARGQCGAAQPRLPAQRVLRLPQVFDCSATRHGVRVSAQVNKLQTFRDGRIAQIQAFVFDMPEWNRAYRKD